MVRKLIRCLLCVVLVFSFSSQVNAYVHTGLKQSDPENVQFAVSNTASQYVYRCITYAETWETYCDPIGISQVGTGNETIYVYGELGVENGSFAITSYNDDKTYSVITFYKDFLTLSVSEQNETIVHEFGHALGLDHCQCWLVDTSVMRESGFNGYAHPLNDDISGILALYPMIG